MNENFIPPSEDDSSDSEVFKTFFHGNNLTKVSDAEYEPPTSNSNYSQLVPVQIPAVPAEWRIQDFVEKGRQP